MPTIDGLRGDYRQIAEGRFKEVFIDPVEDHFLYTPTDREYRGDERYTSSDRFEEMLRQTTVWEDNITTLHEEGLPLAGANPRNVIVQYGQGDEDAMYRESRPALLLEYESRFEPLNRTFESIESIDHREPGLAEQVRAIQDGVHRLIHEGSIAMVDRDIYDHDFKGEQALRNIGVNEEGEAGILDFGEYHPRLAGPYEGEEYLEAHNISIPDTSVPDGGVIEIEVY